MRHFMLFAISIATFLFQPHGLRGDGPVESPIWSAADVSFDGTFSCKEPQCLTIEEATDQTTLNGFESRKGFIALYQSKIGIIEKLGRILPRISLGLGMDGTAINISSYLGSFLGILLPSNWFNWGESIFFYFAQKYMLMNLLENQFNMTEIAYYQIHQLLIVEEIYKFYTGHLRNFINYIERTPHLDHNPNGEKRIQTFELEVFYQELMTNLVSLQGQIGSAYVDLAQIMSVKPTIQKMGITPLILPKLMQTKKITFEEYKEDVLDDNPEIKIYNNLIKASRYARKARYFNFLQLSGGMGMIDFGVDTLANILIAKSEVKRIKIEREQVINNCLISLEKVVVQHNNLIDVFTEASKGREQSIKSLKDQLTRYYTRGELEPLKLIQTIRWIIGFEINRNSATHTELITISNLENLTTSPKHQKLEALIPKRIKPSSWKQPDAYKEDIRIKKDVEKGVVSLD